MQSMTGFAVEGFEAAGRRWRFEARSVNGRGLDLRFRLAEGAEALEPDLRADAGKRLARGNVSFALRAEEGGEAPAPALNPAALDAAIGAAKAAEARAAAAGLDLAPATAAQLLALRGVMDPGGAPPGEDSAPAFRAAFGRLLSALVAAREAEGARTGAVLSDQVAKLEALTAAAEEAHAEQAAGAAARLAEKVALLQAAGAETAPERLAQELALIAVKADVREEIDRLKGHVAAARALLAAKGPTGRKLDFLTQEFNREANTLCSKAASAALTAIGLDLKVVIDQMREQAQNVE